MGLSLAVSGATTDNLHDLGKRGAYADGDAVLAPLPVEALLCGAEGDKDVERIAAVHALQIRLQRIALLVAVFYEVAYGENTPIRSFHLVEIVIIVAIYNLADILDNLRHLVVLIHKCPGLAVGVWNMNKCFLVSIEYIGNGCKVVALEKAIANAKAFQPFIAVELLIVVVVDSRLKHSLVFGAHHRDGVATEV